MTTQSEERVRLEPKPRTMRKLWFRSGNQCALEKCRNPLLTEEGSWIGNAAHIYPVGRTAARGEHDLTNEQLREFKNLMLTCSNHHKEIDDPDIDDPYTIEQLQNIKGKHESRYKDQAETLARVLDMDEWYTRKYPTHLGALRSDGYLTEDDADNIDTFKPFIDFMAKQSGPTRHLLYIAMKHGQLTNGPKNWVQVSAITVLDMSGMDSQEVSERVNYLEELGVISQDDGGGGTWFDLRDKVSTEDDMFKWLYRFVEELQYEERDAILSRAFRSLDFAFLEG